MTPASDSGRATWTTLGVASNDIKTEIQPLTVEVMVADNHLSPAGPGPDLLVYPPDLTADYVVACYFKGALVTPTAVAFTFDPAAPPFTWGVYAFRIPNSRTKLQ